MGERWIRGVAVFGGAIGGIAMVSGIMHLIGSTDATLASTFIALGSASFALAIHDGLRARLPGEDD